MTVLCHEKDSFFSVQSHFQNLFLYNRLCYSVAYIYEIRTYFYAVFMLRFMHLFVLELGYFIYLMIFIFGMLFVIFLCVWFIIAVEECFCFYSVVTWHIFEIFLLYLLYWKSLNRFTRYKKLKAYSWLHYIESLISCS